MPKIGTTPQLRQHLSHFFLSSHHPFLSGFLSASFSLSLLLAEFLSFSPPPPCILELSSSAFGPSPTREGFVRPPAGDGRKGNVFSV